MYDAYRLQEARREKSKDDGIRESDERQFEKFERRLKQQRVTNASG